MTFQSLQMLCSRQQPHNTDRRFFQKPCGATLSIESGMQEISQNSPFEAWSSTLHSQQSQNTDRRQPETTDRRFFQDGGVSEIFENPYNLDNQKSDTEQVLSQSAP